MKPNFSFYSSNFTLFLFLFLFFFFFSTFIISTSANNPNPLIQQTCEKSSEKDPNINLIFCISSLTQATTRSHNHSRRRHHDYHHHHGHHHHHHHHVTHKRKHEPITLGKLGLVSLRLIRHNVTATRHHIKKLLISNNQTKQNDVASPYVKSCLEDCLELYSDALPTIKDAGRAFRAKRYEDANIEISSVMDAPTTCEDGFDEGEGVVSPLTKMNDDIFQLSAIALSIINMLL